MEQFTWQQTDQGHALDLRLYCKTDGTIVVHSLKDNESESFNDIDQATEYFSSLVEQGMSQGGTS